MADKVKTTYELKFEFAFADGDTRIYRVKNPISDNAALNTAIEDIDSYIQQNHLIIGDKAAGAFTGIYRAKVINTTKTQLDIGIS